VIDFPNDRAQRYAEIDISQTSKSGVGSLAEDADGAEESSKEFRAKPVKAIDPSRSASV
jgi:hypothetical protein